MLEFSDRISTSNVKLQNLTLSVPFFETITNLSDVAFHCLTSGFTSLTPFDVAEQKNALKGHALKWG